MRKPTIRGPWTTVDSRPSSELEQYLRIHEPIATVMSDRFRRNDFDKRGRRGGRFHLWKEHAAVYQGSGGFFFSHGIADIASDTRATTSLWRRIGSFTRANMIMGTDRDVAALGTILRSEPENTVSYDLLFLSRSTYPPLRPPPRADVVAVHPQIENWRSLLQLQIDYEIEEVLLPGRRPIASNSKAQLLDSLTNHLVLVALHRGEPIARVATNARGYTTDQIGGVYTVPRWRGQGIASWLMTHLLHEMKAEERDASLFVKHTNPVALRLYRRLGFAFESTFRISYYH